MAAENDINRDDEAEFYVLLRIRRGELGKQIGTDFISARKNKPEAGLLREAKGTDTVWVRMRTYVPMSAFLGIQMQKQDPIGAWGFPVECPPSELA